MPQERRQRRRRRSWRRRRRRRQGRRLLQLRSGGPQIVRMPHRRRRRRRSWWTWRWPRRWLSLLITRQTVDQENGDFNLGAKTTLHCLCIHMVSELYSCTVLLARSKVPRLVVLFLLHQPPPCFHHRTRSIYVQHAKKTKKKRAYATALGAAALYLERPNSICANCFNAANLRAMPAP